MEKKVKIFDLIMLILVLAIYITLFIAGFFPAFKYETHNFNYSFYDLNELYGYFPFVAFASLVPIVVLTTRIFLNKTKDCKQIRSVFASLYLMNFVIGIAVLASTFASLKSDRSAYGEIFQLNAIFVVILFLIAIFSFLTAGVFNIFRTVKLPKSEKKPNKKKKQDSQQAIQKLRELKMLFDAGAIPQDVYEEKRKKYTDSI